MTQTIIAPHNRTIRFYGCGGTGINIVRQYREGVELLNGVRLSEEFYSLIDTGLSNLKDASSADVYTIPGVDGSGGDPSRNAVKISKALPEILEQHPPADTNVVIASLGGGSGTAILPQLVSHLLTEGHTVFVVLVGVTEDESLRNIRNAIVTLKNLELGVQRSGRPLPISYTPLDPMKSLPDNNVKPLFVLSALSIMSSGHNPRLDKADIENFIDYHRVTPQEPSLALLEITLSEEQVRARGKVTSYIALMNSENQPAPRIQCDYSKHGLVCQDTNGENSYFYTIQANLGDIFEELQKLEKLSSQRRTVKVERQELIKGEVTVDSTTGLIFD